MTNNPATSKKERAEGLVYVFTGDGKGKTSAALGMGVRAALRGMKVGMVCWYKEPRWQLSELGLPKKIKNFRLYLQGKGFYRLPTDHATEKEHRGAAQAALEKARALTRRVDLLILDEVNNAVSDRLIKTRDVVDLVKKREGTHVVLTGRNAPKSFVRMADLVTEMKKVRHPFDQGRKAIPGLDY